MNALRYSGWLLLYGLLHAAKLLVDWAIEHVEKRIKGDDKDEEKGG
ncbi:hypothetical protein WMF30_10175 [Sorangium sp. So ce134]